MARYYPRGSGWHSDDENTAFEPVTTDEFYEGATHNVYADWLYEDDWTKEKLGMYELATHIPLLNSYTEWLLDVREDEEYLRRFGMDYSDVHDPRKLHQTSSGSRAIGGAINFVSAMVTRLYR